MGASSERKLVRKLLPHGIAVVALVGAFAAARPQSRPNIVFVLSDDQAHDTLSIAAHRPVMTPNLDRLAREGVWFRQAAVVTPLCAPSRAAFLTGLYGHTSGFRTNNGPWPEKFPPSFLSVAHEAGYRTAFIGKKHIYNTDEPLPGMTPEQVAEKKLKNYYRCVTALDDYVGRIRKALEETGVLDRTIFAYAGDNGYFLADHGRFEKMTPHEESVRVPFLMRYPP